MQVWLMMVSSLACFNIGRAMDAHGNELELNDEYHTEGFVTYVKRRFSRPEGRRLIQEISRHKKEYKCSILPRYPISRELITERSASL